MFLSEILNIINIKKSIKDLKINKVKTDSRLIEPNDIFITINSGYKYIESAIEKGACLVITDKDVHLDNDKVIKVDDTIKVLGLVAQHIRNKYKGTVIAITGSNGKTTTKELLTYILSSKYKVLSTKDSFNNNIGVPNTILELDNSYDYMVLELGTNHIGEIKYLSDIVNPNISIITNIGTSHIGNFKSIENILKEKLDIKKNSTLFVNGEDKYLKNIDAIKVYSSDYNYKCDISHLTMDYYLVFKVCEYLDMDINEIISLASNFKTKKSRMEIININNITIIDDSYNASFESVVAGINSLYKYKSKLIILGDMLELGDESYNLHKKLKEYIDNQSNVTLITVGEYTSILNSSFHFDSTYKLEEYIRSINYNKFDVIYIKGAHKYHLYDLAPVIKEILQN